MSVEPAVALRIDAAPSGGGDRLAALFDTHEDRLSRLARRLVTNSDDARDLVQETFLRAARSLSSIPSRFAQEEAWLVRVLINIRRDQWRKAAVRQRAAATLRDHLLTDASDPESSLVTKRAVWAALDVLQPRRRAVVVMHELEGMNPSAIARVLGIAEMTVRWHLSMGRRDLKRILKPYVGDIA